MAEMSKVRAWLKARRRMWKRVRNRMRTSRYIAKGGVRR